MNVVVLMLAGGILGWIAFSYAGFNEERGLIVSITIGAVGGLVGGKLIAPMFNGAPAVPDPFSVLVLFSAAAAAAAFLAVGNLVYKRWGM